MSGRDEPESEQPQRRVPPAGNGSLGGGPDTPVAVPSSVFVARQDPAPVSDHPARVAADPPPDEPRRPPGVAVALEAGPFAGLADLDAFERRLRALHAVMEVRLCRFGDAWAEFELTIADVEAPLQREVREQLPDALVGLTATGLRIELGAGG